MNKYYLSWYLLWLLKFLLRAFLGQILIFIGHQLPIPSYGTYIYHALQIGTRIDSKYALTFIIIGDK